jgi:hypothetical protein
VNVVGVRVEPVVGIEIAGIWTVAGLEGAIGADWRASETRA